MLCKNGKTNISVKESKTNSNDTIRTIIYKYIKNIYINSEISN